MKRLIAFVFLAFVITSCSSGPPISQDTRTAIRQTLFDAQTAYEGTVQKAMVVYLVDWPRCKVPRTPGVIRCHDRNAEVPLNNAAKAATVAFKAAWNSINNDPTAPITTVDLLVTTAKNMAAAVVSVMQIYSAPLDAK